MTTFFAVIPLVLSAVAKGTSPDGPSALAGRRENALDIKYLM